MIRSTVSHDFSVCIQRFLIKYTQVVGIPMGTNCVSLMAVYYIYFYLPPIGEFNWSGFFRINMSYFNECKRASASVVSITQISKKNI